MLEIQRTDSLTRIRRPPILQRGGRRRPVSEVGILIVDDDVASQQALKLILDSEGWHVRIVVVPAQAMSELASGIWDLAIVNVALLDMRGPVFSTLAELSQAHMSRPEAGASAKGPAPRARQFRVLFLVPLMGSK